MVVNLEKSADQGILAGQLVWTPGTNLYTVPEFDEVCRPLCVVRRLHNEAGRDRGLGCRHC